MTAMPKMIQNSEPETSAQTAPSSVSGVMTSARTSCKNTDELIPAAAVSAMQTNTAIMRPL